MAVKTMTGGEAVVESLKVNEVDTVVGLIGSSTLEILDALYRLYSEKAPGYQYSPAYKRRQWDGNVHFVSRTGTFRTGLLNRVLEDLKKIDCTPELYYEANATKYETTQNYEIDGFSYYSYQKELIERGLADKRGIIKSPTGSGKR